MPAIAEITLAVLRHLSMHGLCTKEEIVSSTGTLPASTLGNLLHLGHVRTDRTQDKVRYAITPRGLARLQGLPLPRPQSPAQRARYAASGAPLPAASLRPGSLDAFALPSRMGDRLHWPDGSVTGLDHSPYLKKENHGR